MYNLPGALKWSLVVRIRSTIFPSACFIPPLLFQEFVYAAIAALFYLIAASVQVARTAQGEYFVGAITTDGGILYSLYDRYMAAGVSFVKRKTTFVCRSPVSFVRLWLRILL